MNTEQERAALLPCPFCGETEGLIIQHCEGTIIHPALRIYCDNCGASSGYSDRVDPGDIWNRRAALQSQNKEAMRVIETARRAMDNSTECGDRFGGIALSSDDAAALSLSLDEYDHARRGEGDSNADS